MRHRASITSELFVIISLLILYLVYWTFMPYRNKPWFKSNFMLSNINEFRGIKLTQESNSIIKYFKKEFGFDLKGEKLLITGRLPFLYFALNSYPATCMSYFHSMPNDDFLKKFKNCLESKAPKYILSFEVFQKNDIYLNNNSQQDIPFKINFFQKIFLKNQQIKDNSKNIFRKYILREPVGQSISEVDQEVNKFIENYRLLNSYDNCKTNSLPSFIIKDLNFIYPNAINIEYKLCTKS